MDDTRAWEAAIADLADLLDLIETAVEDDDWERAVDTPVELSTAPLPPAPSRELAERARAVLDDAVRIGDLVRAQRDAVQAELAAGGNRRQAAARYGASARLA